MKRLSKLVVPLLMLGAAPHAYAQVKKARNTQKAESASQQSSPNEKNALSKDYRKSATVALASVATWEKTATAMNSSVTMRGDGIYVNRAARSREREARETADRDVRLAKLDAETPADKELQKEVEQYYEAVKAICDASVDASAALVTPTVQDSARECPLLIKKAIENGFYKALTKDEEKCTQP